MRICFLSYDYPSPLGSGGVGNQTKILASALAREGHEVSVIDSYRPGFPEECEEEGVKIYRVKTGNLHWYVYRTLVIGGLFSRAVLELEQSWGAYRLIKKLNNRKPFDLIETSEARSFWVSLLLKNIPIAVRLHGEEYTFFKHTPSLVFGFGIKLARALQRIAMRRAKVFISPSVAHAQEIRNEFGLNLPPLKVIPYMIEIKELKTMPRDGNILLYAGRLERRKGICELLQAFGEVIRQFPNARLLLAGGAHPTLSRFEIERLVEENSIRNHVEFLGHLTSEKLSEIYRRTSIAIFPSYYETLGVSAMEPMVYKIPVIATLSGALPEVIENERNGLLVPAGDVQALSKAMIRLLKDPQLRERMGEEGCRLAKQKFPYERIFEKNLQVYEAILRGEDGNSKNAKGRTLENPIGGPMTAWTGARPMGKAASAESAAHQINDEKDG